MRPPGPGQSNGNSAGGRELGRGQFAPGPLTHDTFSFCYYLRATQMAAASILTSLNNSTPSSL